ncbi:MAG: hypothetical protein NTW31_07590 [Bacteroidetes bacterium]|nr:hypothetical protein [Bacteroidota bacterium]
MKRYIILPWLSVFILADGLYMLLSPMVKNTWIDLVQGILMTIIGLFGLYQGVSAAWSAWRGDPLKDELTRKIRLKASSISFYISIWVWIGLMFAEKNQVRFHSGILGTGVLIMIGVYIISSVVIRIRGLRDE